MEYFMYEGKIPNLGVVPGNVVDDLIRQRMHSLALAYEFVVRTADVGAVEPDLLQKGKQDAEKLLVYLSISFHAQTLYSGVHVGKTFLGETAETS
jgi:hypothetical protein